MPRKIFQAVIAVALTSVAAAPAIGPNAAAAAACIGDCNGDGAVRISELLTAVNIALGVSEVDSCASFDCHDLPGVIFIDCAIVAVTNALSNCAPDVPPTPHPLSTLEEHCGRVTAADLLAGVRPEYSDVLIPRPETGWGGAVPFTVALTYAAGAITCYPRYVPPPWSTRPVIDEQVGVVVELAFDTADGRFAERVDTELKGNSHGGSLSFSRRPEELEGTYRPDLPGYDDVRVGMWANFWGDWSNGGVNQSGVPPGHVSLYIPLGYWQSAGDPPPRY